MGSKLIPRVLLFPLLELDHGSYIDPQGNIIAAIIGCALNFGHIVARGITQRRGWFPCMGLQTTNHKKQREMGGTMALGGSRLMKIPNNQVIVGGSSRIEVGMESQGGQSVWADIFYMTRLLN